jgi:hypothetical protein
MSPGHFAPVAQRTPPFRFNNHLEQHSLLLSQRQPVEPAAQVREEKLTNAALSARYGACRPPASGAAAGRDPGPLPARRMPAGHGVELADHAEAERNVQDWINVSKSLLIVSACVVGIPCGKPAYVFSVPFCTSSTARGPEVA